MKAVKEALERLGLQDVRDLDDELDKSGKGSVKREDLQVHGRSPTLLVEVKGINGTPSEDEAMQVQKYVLPRIREWGRNDVRGLSIINHQRHLPALQREHESVFQPDVLTNAGDEFGLMTTWEIFRLARNAERLGWSEAATQPLFYGTGRIGCIPAHYTYVGVIDNYWDAASAFSIALAAELAVGQTIAVEGPIDFWEQSVDSLQLDDEGVGTAAAGDLVGVKASLTKKQAHPGWRVFRVDAL